MSERRIDGLTRALTDEELGIIREMERWALEVLDDERPALDRFARALAAMPNGGPPRAVYSTPSFRGEKHDAHCTIALVKVGDNVSPKYDVDAHVDVVLRTFTNVKIGLAASDLPIRVVGEAKDV